ASPHHCACRAGADKPSPNTAELGKKRKKEREREREKENEHGIHGQEKSEWDMEHRAWCSVIAMDVPAKEQGGAAAQDVNPRPLFLHQRRAPSGESPPHLLPLGHDRYC
ncbi:unnamed protein product, partial [Musa banksii]